MEVIDLGNDLWITCYVYGCENGAALTQIHSIVYFMKQI